jgi:hypothetical protein
MFTKSKETVIVKTKEELQKAVKSKAEKILVKGELAEKLNRSLEMKKVSTATIGAIACAGCATPFTGGLGALAAVSIAVLTGLEIALIIAVFFIGLALVLMVCKEFIKVRFTAKHGDTEAELELERGATV